MDIFQQIKVIKPFSEHIKEVNSSNTNPFITASVMKELNVLGSCVSLFPRHSYNHSQNI